MIIIKVSNQRSYFYIRINDLSIIGFVWQKLSQKGFYKFHEYYDLNDEQVVLWYHTIKGNDNFYDSLQSFLKR